MTRTRELRVSGETLYADANGIRVAYERAGSGFPLLLLHGFPRTRKLWSRVTPLLTDRFDVVAMDRRGYGDSERPPAAAGYDNATQARDAIGLTQRLGWERFLLVGHDRGSPVAQRVAFDYPDQVAGLMLLDAMPPASSYQAPRDSSGRSWYMDFFKQRSVAEAIMNRDPRLFFGLFVDRHTHLGPEEREYYVESYSRPGGVEAVLADYRSGFDIDRAFWEEQRREGRKLQVPFYVIWAADGPVARAPVLETWPEAAADLRGGGMVQNTAHYIQEQQPAETASHLKHFANLIGIP
jgi:haloacetate dehalogenase